MLQEVGWINRNQRSAARTLSVVALLAFFFSTNAGGQSLIDHEHVSIISLIATPERFDKKKIAIAGWLFLKREDMSLCVAQEVPSSKECVWVILDDGRGGAEAQKQLTELRRYENQKVLVHATYDMRNKGHLGGWSGAIQRIARVAPLQGSK